MATVKNINTNPIYTIEITGGQKVIKFAKKLDKSQSLSDIRNKLGDKISSKIIFTLPNGTDICQENENEFSLEEIIDGSIVHLKNIEENLKSDIDIYVNEKFKVKKRLIKSEKLNVIRNIISNIITENGFFLSKDKNEIIKGDEREFLLEEILDKNKINIKIPDIEESQNMPNSPEATINCSTEIYNSQNTSFNNSISSAPIIGSFKRNKRKS